MTSTLLALVLFVMPVDESTLALHYKPCLDMYEAAKASSDPQAMARVIRLCTLNSPVVEQ